MTPKEKAEQLIFKYEKSLFNYFTTDEEYVICVNCALIAVDEIINSFGLKTDDKKFYTSYDAIKYYQEVKQEIEKL
jgi:hypothetical protein